MTPPSNAGGEGREVLAPCPFCGGDNIAYVAGDECEYTTCDDCLANGPVAATEAEAQAAWNTRPARENADDRAPALVEAAVAEMRERALDRAWQKLGHVTIEAMEGDNLAVTLCSRFDDLDQEQDENGWSEAAVNGCDATLKAIHEVYTSVFRALPTPSQEASNVG